MVASPESELSTLSTEALADAIAKLAAGIDAATYRLLCRIREFDRRSGWAEDGCLSCVQWLNWRLGWSPHTARERLRVAYALEDLPRLSAALERGEVSYSKIRAITRVATPDSDSDAEWLNIALHSTASQLDKIVRRCRRRTEAESLQHAAGQQESRMLRTYFDENGMLVIEGRLPPEAGAVVMKALDAATDALRREGDVDQTLDVGQALNEESPEAQGDCAPSFQQERADALLHMAEASLGATKTSATGDRYQVVVHVDAEVLADPEAGGRSDLEDGPDVPAGTSRRLACDASVVTMLHAADGSILGVGRKTRVIPSALRRALRERDGGCRWPGCHHRYHLDAHHLRHWSVGGATELGNLLELCRRHHGMVHEGDFRVEALADGGVAFYRPDGTRLAYTVKLPGVDGDAQSILEKDNVSAGVVIDAMTAYPKYDGTPVDYEWISAIMSP